MPTNTIVWKPSPNQGYHVLDEVFLTTQDSAEALALNDSAARFTEACDGLGTVDETIDSTRTRFDLSAVQLAADLWPFIDKLARKAFY